MPRTRIEDLSATGYELDDQQLRLAAGASGGFCIHEELTACVGGCDEYHPEKLSVDATLVAD